MPTLDDEDPSAAELAMLDDEALLEQLQRQSFRYFWEGSHPTSGLAPDRRPVRAGADDDGDPMAIGGTGFALMALVVAVERRWVAREAVLERLARMLELLLRAPSYHGVLPHFVNGRTGATIPFTRKDDAGDLVETSFLCMGLLCSRQYFDRDTPAERALRAQMTQLWEEVEWSWYTRAGRPVLYWHWSPNHGWAMEFAIHGWNECLITYVLAASSPRYAIDPVAYHRGFASGREYLNGHSYRGIELPLGPPQGGPLFFTHYSFLGLDPRGLHDRYADYWRQNLHHVRINRAHCVANPRDFAGYGEGCWGLTSSDDPDGYASHSPAHDNGTIAPTAALSSFPYTPVESMQALRHFLGHYGERIWGRYGFIDAFCEQRHWYASHFLAIDQGPIVLMIENYRTALLWRLFMSVPEVQQGLRRLEFRSPHLEARSAR